MQPNIYPESPRTKRHTKRRGSYWFVLLMVVLFATTGISYAILLYLENQPNREYTVPYEGIKNPTLLQGELVEDSARFEDGKILLPFDLIKSVMDPYIFWDEGTESVIITTEDKVLRLPNERLQAFINESPFTLSLPVQKEEDQIYIPFEPLATIYPFEIVHHTETGVTLIDPYGLPMQKGTITRVSKKDSTHPLRKGPSIKEPIYLDLPIEASVRILGEQNGWYWVMSEHGITGYMKKEQIILSGIEVSPNPIVREESYTPWKPLGGKINLTWEHVVSRNPKTENIPQLSGVNVISPTWFEIKDDEGNIANNADLEYVRWAHQRGYQVWALISNGFNPDRTHNFLADFNTRKKIIRQMVQYAEMYKLDGFNIDFENVYLKDKENFVQFMRELTPYLHEKDLVVSVDVTIKSTSETWSMFYDRKALGEVVDYVAVMTYDEHWASSPIAGSVASLPWVEKGLQGILDDVPANKVLLGVPYYTRLWSETTDSSGKVKVKQKAISMETATKWIQERNLVPVFDEKTGQHYVEHYDSKDGVTYKIWLEDATSMKQRAELVKKYNLAGIASWRRGFESQDIWQVIEDTFSSRP